MISRPELQHGIIATHILESQGQAQSAGKTVARHQATHFLKCQGQA